MLLTAAPATRTSNAHVTAAVVLGVEMPTATNSSQASDGFFERQVKAIGMFTTTLGLCHVSL